MRKISPISEIAKKEEVNAKTERFISIVLKAVAPGIAVVSIVLGFIPEADDIGNQVTLLSVGLLTLSLAALIKEE